MADAQITATPPRGELIWLGPSCSSVRLLIVAPHPDDEVIGPGGLALLQSADGVGALILTDGARGAGGQSEEGLADRRKEESLAGLRLVAARFGYFPALNSGEVKSDPGGAAAEAIRWCVETFKPAVVLTTAPFERHATHLATTIATLRALRPLEDPPALRGYPVWDGLFGERGVERVDIGSVLERKMEAVRCHQSQMQARAFDDAVRCRNRLDALLVETTGPASAEYVECTLDLSDLLAPDAPALSEWVGRRVRSTFGEI